MSGGAADELTLLRASSRECLAMLSTKDAGKAASDGWHDHWQILDELGLWSTLKPPEGSLRAAIVVSEEVGRALYAGPACEALVAGLFKDRIDTLTLPRAAATSPAAIFTSGRVAQDPLNEYIRVDSVVAVPPRTILIVAADNDEVSMRSASEAETADICHPDVSRRLVEYRLPPADGLDTEVGPKLVRRARAARSILYCADTYGGVAHVLERTVEYAKQRNTFDVPIGKYQAVAHRLVDHTLTVKKMRTLLDDAAATFDEGIGDCSQETAILETFFFGRGSEIISDCIQLVGAVGFTWEFGFHAYLRRALANTALHGAQTRPHRRVVIGKTSASDNGPDPEFRMAARDFIAAESPAGPWYDGVRVPRDSRQEKELRDWYGSLFAEKLIGGSWPTEYGGRKDHSPRHDAIVMEEIIRARAPKPLDKVLLAAHLIIRFGSDEQRAQYLPRIRSAKDIWCQLFSEPAVGSDLARLTTRAVLQPDGTFVVNGQKVWTTDGQWSQMGVLLARTDPEVRPHQGITAFVVDMSSPGIDVRPIREMTGSQEFCEVYLDGVVVPGGNVLGGIGNGWAVVNSRLASERAYVGANAVVLAMLAQDLVELARAIEYRDGKAFDDPAVHDAIAELTAEVCAVQHIARQSVDRFASGKGEAADGMVAKLTYTELNVAMCSYAMTLAASGRLTDRGAEVYARWRQAFLWSRALTISGGSSEIIRNVLATQLLGLPRSW